LSSSLTRLKMLLRSSGCFCGKVPVLVPVGNRSEEGSSPVRVPLAAIYSRRGFRPPLPARQKSSFHVSPLPLHPENGFSLPAEDLPFLPGRFQLSSARSWQEVEHGIISEALQGAPINGIQASRIWLGVRQSSGSLSASCSFHTLATLDKPFRLQPLKEFSDGVM